MDATRSSEVYQAAGVLARLARLLVTQTESGQWRVEAAGCKIVGGGKSVPCAAVGDTTEDAMIKLLGDVRRLPIGYHVVNDKGTRLRLVNDMWSRIDRVKGGV